KLRAGQSQVVVLSRPTNGPADGADRQGGLAPGLHQVEVSLASADQLPFNNRAFATFRVREGRRVLVIADRPADARSWADALVTSSAFSCDVRTTAEAEKLGAEEFGTYRAVCLLDVARPSDKLWDDIEKVVRHKGVGLAVVPGGEGWK